MPTKKRKRGRPPLAYDTAPLHVRIDVRLLRALHAHAERRGEKLTAIVSRYVRDGIAADGSRETPRPTS